MCGEKWESRQHVINERKKIAQRECKLRHDKVAEIMQWKICER